MPERQRIGLDNPYFQGRLRTPDRRAQSSHVSVRPSARYFNDIIALPKAKLIVSQPSPQIVPALNSFATVPIKLVKPQPFVQPKLHRPERSQVLKRQTVLRPDKLTKTKRHKPERNRTQLVMTGMAVIVFLVGLSVSLVTLQTNKSTKTQVAALAKQADNAPATSDTAQSSSQPSVPSTTPPAPKAVAAYAVAPDMPKYLDIPKLKVHARVLSLGILSSGALATPNNLYDTGWYNASAKPGDSPTRGAMLIDGHVAGWGKTGVFYYIKDLVAGDEISITRGDNTVYKYKVVKSQSYPIDSVDMQAAITPVTPGKPGLNLITCFGSVMPKNGHFDHRLMVFTEQE